MMDFAHDRILTLELTQWNSPDRICTMEAAQ